MTKKITYECDLCKRESDKETKTVNVDICEECFNDIKKGKFDLTKKKPSIRDGFKRAGEVIDKVFQ